MNHLQSVEQFEEWKQSEAVVFLFTAGWCPDCVRMEPFLPEIEKKFDQFTFISVDRDQFIDICRELDVFGIPSFISFSNGTEVNRFVDRNGKSQEQVEAFLIESLQKMSETNKEDSL